MVKVIIDWMQGNPSTVVGLLILIFPTIIEVAPIKISPWSALAGWIGKKINGGIMKELEGIKELQSNTDKKIEKHIRVDNTRWMDSKRRDIIRFNNEICRGERHTQESFVDILKDIDEYEAYCNSHKEYPNSRATCAIANIKRTYQLVMQKGDFLPEGRPVPESRSVKKKGWLL